MTTPLFEPPRPAPGRHEKALTAALELARRDGYVEDIDAALVSLAIANAWGLDQAEREGKPYAVSQLTAPYREVLELLGMTPASRKVGESDGLDEALRVLAE